MKTTRFLITPNYETPCDQRMVNGLADGLRTIGHEALALQRPVSALDLVRQCKEHSPDVVIQINRTRHPEVSLPDNIRYISWFQDIFPETLTGLDECFAESDILYALGDPGVIGINVGLPCHVGSLLCGVSESIFDRPFTTSHGNRIDFSLCGFIPPPPIIITRNFLEDLSSITRLKPLHATRRLLAIIRRVALGFYTRAHRTNNSLMSIMMRTVRDRYEPLKGSLDIHELSSALREATASDQEAMNETFIRSALMKLIELARGTPDPVRQPVPSFNTLPPYERSINYFTREYPRLMDRELMIDKVMQVSSSIELYGPGWEMHQKYAPYAKGTIDTQEGLLEIYQRSKINLANNTHGLGLHSRTLECMAVEGFILTHQSPHDTKPGGMLTSFEPGVHYGSFTPENLETEAKHWLSEDGKRAKAGELAAQIVRNSHCWHHRASQIVNDLKK